MVKKWKNWGYSHPEAQKITSVLSYSYEIMSNFIFQMNCSSLLIFSGFQRNRKKLVLYSLTQSFSCNMHHEDRKKNVLSRFCLWCNISHKIYQRLSSVSKKLFRHLSFNSNHTFFNTIFVSSNMYPENPKGTQVIVGSMNMGFISDTAKNRTHNLFRPKREPIPPGHSDIACGKLINCVSLLCM